MKILNDIKTISFYNLGCKVNLYEIEKIRKQFINNNFKEVKFGDFSDITIVNTCSVTSMADHKSKQILHKVRKANKNGIIVATGCFVQANYNKFKNYDNLSYVDLCVDNYNKENIYEIVINFINKNNDKKIKNKNLNNIIKYDYFLNKSWKRTRAFLKIQDGCNKYCSYCSIPNLRKHIKSKKIKDVIEEIKNLIDIGYKEIVLTGINIELYGLNEDFTLLDLIKEIECNFKKNIRIRFSSLNPNVIMEEFLDVLKKSKIFCHQFHLSVQSGSNDVLKSMNRRYTVNDYIDKVNMIRNNLKHSMITTDIIVGFPGETDEFFKKTIDFVKKIKFLKIHIFRYSKREDTLAVKRKQVSEIIKKQRSNILFDLNDNIRLEILNKFINKEKEILIESTKKIKNNYYDFGYTQEYIPVYIKINKKDINKNFNKFITITIKKIEKHKEYVCIGEYLDCL